MQTPKARINSPGGPQKTSPLPRSSEVSQKNSSPQAASKEVSQKTSPRVVRQLKSTARYSDHTASSLNLATKVSKDRNPQVADRKTPRSPVFELEMVAESEVTWSKHLESGQTDIRGLKQNLVETLRLVEDMKNQLRECKKSEAQAHELVGETLTQLEAAKKMVETLRLDGFKTMEAYDAVASELDLSRARVKFLEELVGKLQADVSCKDSEEENNELEIIENVRIREGSIEAELNSVKVEVEQLRLALKAAEISYNEEKARGTEQVRNNFEMVEQIKSTSSQKEAELDAELRKSRYEIEELKANLMDKETELQGICEENEGLVLKLENMLLGQREHELENELQKLKAEVENLKAFVMDKETEWLNASEENEMLKLEIKKISNGKVSDELVSDLTPTGSAEKEAHMKIGNMTEEADMSNRKAARVAEQLEAAQAANAEMETELRRLKVQSNQWRKAAEAAAAMLSTGNNGQLMERTGSIDSSYSPRMGKISLPYADDLDEELMKKKNANMLRRFGVLWKKQQK